MATIGFNQAIGYTEHQCESCGKVVPWSETNMLGDCKECQTNEKTADASK
ncbi:hypothetical protein [Paenibacillus sp. Pae108]|nr:hypothetical protein [Paenibacillus sp. Pae108]